MFTHFEMDIILQSLVVYTKSLSGSDKSKLNDKELEYLDRRIARANSLIDRFAELFHDIEAIEYGAINKTLDYLGEE